MISDVRIAVVISRSLKHASFAEVTRLVIVELDETLRTAEPRNQNTLIEFCIFLLPNLRTQACKTLVNSVVLQ